MIAIVLVDSPASGLFKFLVARGGIDQGLGCSILDLPFS
jgi:hypothetical protein